MSAGMATGNMLDYADYVDYLMLVADENEVR